MQDTSFYAYASENKSSCIFAVFYIITSVALTLVNKIVLSTFKFDFPAFILVLRTICTIIGLEIAKEFDVVSLPKFSISRGQIVALPSLFYSINAILSLTALGKMNIAFFAVLKRCTPLTTMFLSVLILKCDFPSKLTIASLIGLAVGCIIAGIGNLTFSFEAYALCALSNVAQSLHLLFVQRVSKSGLTPIECVHLNSIISLPFFAINAVLLSEFSQVLDVSYYAEPTFVLLLVIQICLGCLLTYLLILCTSMTSAVTTTVIGGVKALLQVAVGILTFGGLSDNLMTYIGLSLSFMGVVTYLISKIRENMQGKSASSKRVNEIEIMDEEVCDTMNPNEKADWKTAKLVIP